jgi:hypothetical protein
LFWSNSKFREPVEKLQINAMQRNQIILYYFFGGGGEEGGGFGLDSAWDFGSRGATVEGFGFAACCPSSGRLLLDI